MQAGRGPARRLSSSSLGALRTSHTSDVAGGGPGAGHPPRQTILVPTLLLEKFRGLVPTSLSPLGLTVLDLVASRAEVLIPFWGHLLPMFISGLSLWARKLRVKRESKGHTHTQTHTHVCPPEGHSRHCPLCPRMRRTR